MQDLEDFHISLWQNFFASVKSLAKTFLFISVLNAYKQRQPTTLSNPLQNYSD